MPIIREGETGTAHGAKNLIYPDVNSCLTLTCICAEGLAIGGHAVMIPGSRYQLSLNKIVDDLTLFGYKKRHLYMIGDTGTWKDNLAQLSRFADLASIARTLGLEKHHTVIDVEKWTLGAKMVQIVFHPATRTLTILPNAGGELLYKENWN